MNFDSALKLLTEFNPEKLLGEKAHFEIAPYRVNYSEFKPNPPNKAAVLMLIYPYLDEAYFTLIQRPSYNGNHSGQIALPGGKWEDKDKNLTQTALREAREEINVHESEVNIIGKLTDIYIPPSNFEVTPIIGISSKRSNFKPNQREVDEILEIPLRDLLNPTSLKETEIKIGNGKTLQTPYFDLKSKVVWGATAMILNEIKCYILDV